MIHAVKVLLGLLIFSPFLVNSQETIQLQWHVEFSPNITTNYLTEKHTISVMITGFTNDLIDLSNINNTSVLRIISLDENIARVHHPLQLSQVPNNATLWQGKFNVSGHFIGSTRFYVEINTRASSVQKSTEYAKVIVIRPRNSLDTIFQITIFVVTTLLYVSFGAAVDLHQLGAMFKSPKGPIIGFLAQFIMMPITAYALGVWLYTNELYMFLGLFFLGISPGGGSSNLWALLLNANLNLSIFLTTLSTVFAFASIPFFTFTLGSTLFEQVEFEIPYLRISVLALGLILPLILGVILQKWPKVAAKLIVLLKPVSLVLVVVLLVLGIITNFHVFALFTWKTVVATLGLPVLGYLFGYFVSKVFRLSDPDALAISIETGVQNFAITIFLIQFSLEQPAIDIAMIIPASVAIMTQLPLLLLFIIKKLIQCKQGNNEKKMSAPFLY